MAAALAWTTQSRLALDAMEAKELQLMTGVFADDLIAKGAKELIQSLGQPE